jgi:DNA-directed RNA polymerase specialized sigma24 family protein
MLTWIHRLFAGAFAALGAKLAFADRCLSTRMQVIPAASKRTGFRQEDLTIRQRQDTLTDVVEPSEVLAQTASADPEVGLRGVASLRALLEAVEELQVRHARELGWSWRQIADLLGVSKQAVHQKYGKGEPRARRRFG